MVLLNPKLRLFLGVAGGLLLTTLCIMGGVNYLSNILFDRLVTITPTPSNPLSATPPSVLGTGTVIATNTPSPIQTSIPPTPTLGIGSTLTSDKDGMILLYVPAGEFTMGSETNDYEKPIHKVNLDAFWIDQTEVTNAMYAK